MKKLFHKILDQNYQVTSTYYDTRGTQLHRAIDIATPVGTTIYSPFKGIVRSIYYNERGGNQLIIEHPQAGYTTGYAHLKDVLVQEGQQVKPGKPIANTGNTGHSTGAHLHFTMRDNTTNQKIDPLPFYDGRYNQEVKRTYLEIAGLGVSILGIVIAISTNQNKK